MVDGGERRARFRSWMPGWVAVQVAPAPGVLGGKAADAWRRIERDSRSAMASTEARREASV